MVHRLRFIVSHISVRENYTCAHSVTVLDGWQWYQDGNLDMQMTKVEYREWELEPIAMERVRLSFPFLSPVHPPGVNFSSSSSFYCRIFNRSSSPFRQPSVSAKFKRAPSQSFTLLADPKAIPFSLRTSFRMPNTTGSRLRHDFTGLVAFFPGQVANDSARTPHLICKCLTMKTLQPGE